MFEDREVLRQIWFGKLPICFHLANDEICTPQKPDPFYMMCPRISYFPLVMDKVIKHFSRFVSTAKSNATNSWIDFEGIPIHWHYPIGLSWDIFSGEATLPWNLQFHFDNFPEDKILKCNNWALTEAMFMSTVKESDALKHRGKVISTMQKREHNQLWYGLSNDRFEQFWEINKKLMEHTDNEPFRSIPFRIYQMNKPFIQKLIAPRLESGEQTTLEDLIKLIFPESFGNLRVITHGIEPPLNTPLIWLSEHLSYPDNFLHICVFTNK